jgi:hypothetical protein
MDPQSDRILALDFTKGALVVFMVVYHALNYLDHGTLPHDYLGFVPASFIMIAGFIVTNVYASRPGFRLSETGARLATRALKLIALFTFLNVGARLVLGGDGAGPRAAVARFLGDWHEVYASGAAAGVAYEVLLPIAYTMLLSIAVLAAGQGRRIVVRMIAVAAFIGVTLLNFAGAATLYVNLVAAGILGMALGTISLAEIDRVAESPLALVVPLSAYVAVVVTGLDTFLSQVGITVAWVLLLYAAGMRFPPSSAAVRIAGLLGRYSLLSYIVQIVYLQAARPLFDLLPRAEVPRVVILTFLTGLATWATVVAVDAARRRTPHVERLYRAVFA